MTTSWVGWMLTAFIVLLLFALGAVIKTPFRLMALGDRATGTVVMMAGDSVSRTPVVEFLSGTAKHSSAGESQSPERRFIVF